MNRHFLFWLMGLLVGCMLLAGCGGGAGVNVQATVDAAVAATASAQSRLQAAIDAAAIATQAAPSDEQSAPVSATPFQPTDAPTPSPTRITSESPAPTATPTNLLPRCEVVTAGLNLRTGPGLAFDPPLRALPRGTVLAPLAFVGSGFPGGQWIEVQVAATAQRGWVSAGAQFVACNVDVVTLPPGAAPATPTPRPPTPTPTRVAVTLPPPPATATRVSPIAVLPVDGGGGETSNIRNGRDVKDGRNVLLPGFEASEVSEPMIFRDRIVFRAEVFDRNVGQTDGAGIESVTFVITDPVGNIVHQRTEYNAGYCVFGGGEPDCVVWRFSEHNNQWPDGAAVRDGFHNVEIIIRPKSGSPVSWFWSFQVARS